MNKPKGPPAGEKRLRPEVAHLTLSGVLVVRLRGRILQDVAEAFMNFVSAQDLTAESPLALTMTEVTYMSSSAIGTLVRIGSECRLKLVAPSDAVRKVLELGEILPMFDIASSETQAVADLLADRG
ncbi:MAG: STAS domain-containing protein [Planctomycetes bacterium]|nr:STAS domain-containing protein [Planctomycetota bacterium]